MNAPFSWPKSSEAIRSRGIAAQFKLTNALAARADYVSVHTLLNAETHHLINAAFLRRMKPTACLINTSRGPVVDEKAKPDADPNTMKILYWVEN